MKLYTLLLLPLLTLTACDGSSTSPTAPKSIVYTDVKASALTSADKSFLARLSAASTGLAILNKTTNAADPSAKASAARKATSPWVCLSPRITQWTDWTVGDSSVDSTTVGAIKNIHEDTLTVYDLVTGQDITCNYNEIITSSRMVSHQSNQEGNLLTSHSVVNILSVWTENLLDLTATLKGTVKYNDGFTFLIDTGYAHMKVNLKEVGMNTSKEMELYYHINFAGFPYSAILHYDKVLDVIKGDVVRGTERIGTMQVLRNDSVTVSDLDGKPITP